MTRSGPALPRANFDQRARKPPVRIPHPPRPGRLPLLPCANGQSTGISASGAPDTRLARGCCRCPSKAFLLGNALKLPTRPNLLEGPPLSRDLCMHHRPNVTAAASSSSKLPVPRPRISKARAPGLCRSQVAEATALT